MGLPGRELAADPARKRARKYGMLQQTPGCKMHHKKNKSRLVTLSPCLLWLMEKVMNRWSKRWIGDRILLSGDTSELNIPEAMLCQKEYPVTPSAYPLAAPLKNMPNSGVIASCRSYSPTLQANSTRLHSRYSPLNLNTNACGQCGS